MSVLSSPKPIMVSAHPTQLTGRYFPVVITTMPDDRANGAMMNVLGRKSTAEWMGDAPKQAWKYTTGEKERVLK